MRGKHTQIGALLKLADLLGSEKHQKSYLSRPEQERGVTRPMRSIA